jgi:hypothetical protein
LVSCLSLLQIYDLAFFLLLLAVFLFAFGIAAQALVYPNAEPTWNILFNVVYQPYFDIYGLLNPDDFLGKCLAFDSRLSSDSGAAGRSTGVAQGRVLVEHNGAAQVTFWEPLRHRQAS